MRITKELKSLFSGIGAAKRKPKDSLGEKVVLQEMPSSHLEEDAQKISALYQLMSEEPSKFLIDKLGRERVQSVVDVAVHGTILEGLKVMEDELDFAYLGKKKKQGRNDGLRSITAAYKSLFSAFYVQTYKISGRESALKLFKGIHDSIAKTYGPHLELVMSKVLPPETIPPETKIAFLAACYKDFANDFSVRLHEKGAEFEEKDILSALKGTLKGASLNPDYNFNFADVSDNLEKTGDEAAKALSSDFGNLIEKLSTFGSVGTGTKGGKHLLDLSFSLISAKYAHSPVEYSLQAIMPKDTIPENKEQEILVACYEDFANEIAQRFHERGLSFDQESIEPSLSIAIEGVSLRGDFSLDFSAVHSNLSRMKGDKKRQLAASFANLISYFYNFGTAELGSENVKKLISEAYRALQQSYGYGPLSLRILTAVPRGVLEQEKLDLLTKGELEKVTKERMRVDELKDQFMNIAAHELKTPLIPIIGYVDMLLKDKNIPTKEKKQLQIVLDAAQREKKLVDDILDISKLESGAMKFYMVEVQLHDLVNALIKELQSAALAKKLKLESHVPKDLPLIHADPKRLSQAIDNLASNAIKFTDKGGISIYASKKKGEIMVEVKDTGIGISKEAMPKLFTKFYQIDSSANRKAGGTGLGLAITKEIVEAHGGKIWVNSRPGRGSTFSFTLHEKKGRHRKKR